MERELPTTISTNAGVPAKSLTRVSVALAITGLVLGTVLVAWYGAGKIGAAVLSAGPAGFALLCAVQLCVCAICGAAWGVIGFASTAARFGVFIWGRMIRDAVSSCLPLSQVGGFVAGARAVTLLGIPLPAATMSTVVDLMSELVSEIAFAAAGLIILLVHSSDAAPTLPIAAGLCLAPFVVFGLFRLQQRIAPLFVRIRHRIMGRASGERDEPAAAELAFAASYGQPGRLALGAAIHLFGWLGKGVGNYIAFRLLGAHIDLASALAIEALLHAMLVFAFLVPGFAGIQEAGYAGLGALFGVQPELAIAVSLLRRARDLAIGIPILLLWQMIEVRRLRGADAA